MFNIDIGHMILLGIIALIFIGPKQLPEVARTIGRLIGELKRASDEVTGSFLTTREKMDQASRETQNEIRDSVGGREIDRKIDLRKESSEMTKPLQETSQQQSPPEGDGSGGKKDGTSQS